MSISKFSMNFLRRKSHPLPQSTCVDELTVSSDSEGCHTQQSTTIQSFVKDFVRSNLSSVTSQIIRSKHQSYDTGNVEHTDTGNVEHGVKKERKLKKKFLKKGFKFAQTSPEGYQVVSECSRSNLTPRANYFIAVQVTNPQILENAKRIQASIFQNSVVDLKHMEVDIRKSHITLMAMHLSDSLAVGRAMACLDQCLPALRETVLCSGPITLDIGGLSVFNGGSVLFANVKPSVALDSLYSMADVVVQKMKEIGVMAAGKAFNPHMTLMKYKWKKQPRNGVKKVEKYAYAEFVKECLGSQTVSSIQLCRMGCERDDGYYIVEHEVFFND